MEEGKKIRALIDIGHYFDDGFNWFYIKYLSQYKTRGIAAVGLCFMLGIIVYVGIIFRSEANLFSSGQSTHVVKLEATESKLLRAFSVPEYYPNQSKNIIRYVIESYVMEFESYDFLKSEIFKLQEKQKIISRFSSRELAEMYRKRTSTSYSKGILQNKKKSVEVTNIFFPQDYNKNLIAVMRNFILPDPNPTMAVVIFKASYYNKVTKKTKTKLAAALVNFNFIFTKDRIDHISDVGFIIIDYRYLNPKKLEMHPQVPLRVQKVSKFDLQEESELRKYMAEKAKMAELAKKRLERKRKTGRA